MHTRCASTDLSQPLFAPCLTLSLVCVLRSDLDLSKGSSLTETDLHHGMARLLVLDHVMVLEEVRG